MTDNHPDVIAAPGPPAQPADVEAHIEDAVQKLAKSPRTVKELLQTKDFQNAVATALPKAMSAERWVRVALTALMRTPELLNCTRESLFRCMLDLSAFGLEPDGRRAHLIPFRRKNVLECTLIVDYKGLVELARRSGEISSIHADVVYTDDKFDFEFGTNQHLTHKPMPRVDGAKPVYFYSFVALKDGSDTFEVMAKGEVDKIRARSKSATEGPWATDYDEMGKKTVFKRHCKWLPLSAEVRGRIEREDSGAIDTTATASTWSDLSDDAPPAGERKRLTAADAIMRHPGFAPAAEKEQ